jgi:uncharacterized protein (DUF427 family)
MLGYDKPKEHHMSREPKTPGPDHPITVEKSGEHVVARLGEQVVADSTTALILREASYPPVYYIPLADVDQKVLTPSETHTYCPYKGEASYYSLTGADGPIADAVWYYPTPYPAVAEIANHAAFYPDQVAISAR